MSVQQFNDRNAKYTIIRNNFSNISELLSLDRLSDEIKLKYTEGDDECSIEYIFCNGKYTIIAYIDCIYIVANVGELQYKFNYDCDVDDFSMIVSAFNILFDDVNNKYLSGLYN